ncbi:MAG: hypothetical protein ACXWJC_03490 [Croceibacterium sp.]
MSAMSPIGATEPADDIRIFLPNIGDEEYAARAKLRSVRNAAGAMIARTESDTARALAWTASNYCHRWLYASADLATLREIGRFGTRLMLCSMQAEHLADEGIEA